MSIQRFFAFSLVSLVIAMAGTSSARAQSQVKVQWQVQGVTETHVLQLGPVGHSVSLTAIQPASSARVQAQCAMGSSLAPMKAPEEGIRLVMTPYVAPTGQFLLQVIFDYQKFLGIEQHEISPGCLVSIGKSMRLNEASTVLLEKRRPVELFRDMTESRDRKGYSVTVELL